ncbi:MAG: ABC transporter ATP-binding protein [Chlamydiales bacterium]|nr:ABC transporter ATP-binding protein [Chlamydiales bacterium]
MPIIRCINLHKTFGEADAKVEALRGVDLSIEAGEIRLLMGPSGSGKTTLISIIAGILTQDVGECWIGDINLNELKNDTKTQFRGKNIGFVFQTFNLIPTLTIEENISIPLILNGIKQEVAIEKALTHLIEMGLQEKIGAYPIQLSGGQQQRVAIARALIHSPQLIVCDEPTSYLDAENGLKVMTLLHDLTKKSHSTLIIVTHDTRITHFADKIDYLEDGKIKTD